MLIHQEWTERILGAAIEVHKHLGPGLLESAYEACLCHELRLREIPFQRQVELPVKYKGALIDCGYRLDIVVADLIVVELKALKSLDPVHEAQLLTYLRLSRRPIGLLINFNVARLMDGVVRRAM